MARLWENPKSQTESIVADYTAAEDALLDNHLVPEDLITNAAHARMLAERGYISAQECRAILDELARIHDAWQSGNFMVSAADEDVHTKIENAVTIAIGEPGKKMHTGRSRNDQVLTDLRLYLRRRLASLALLAARLAQDFHDFAERAALHAMPGYTHMQRAMPSSVALWAGAFTEALADDAEQLLSQHAQADISPLGSGAGYGVSLKIDRELTARLMGFSRVQINPLHCQNSRGKIEGMALAAVSNLMMTLGRFAGDMLLFTTSEYGFFSVADRFTTGSSIMPQKKNLDIMELLRARVHTVQAAEQLVKAIPLGLPSGYSRDLQEMKKPLIEAFSIAESSLAVVSALLGGITVNTERLRAALSAEIYATDAVFRRVEEGVPFRDAYHEIKSALDDVQPPRDSLALALHASRDAAATIGTPANPGLALLLGRVTPLQKRAEAALDAACAIFPALVRKE
ncbi:MAG: argininosuccinate lyase [Spirochaetota bacterium]|nr:argininosuccinate lyase [Spirochaetota bacterium]